MTTIIYRGGVMIGDTMAQYGSMASHQTQKVFRLDSGALVGSAGQMNQCQAFVRHLADPERNPLPPMDQMRALVIFPDDPHLIHEFAYNNVPCYFRSNCAAIGSGERIAMALMRCNNRLSAIEAMTYVADLDTNTGAPFHYESLYEPRRGSFDWLLKPRFHPATVAPRSNRENVEDEGLADDDVLDTTAYTI